MENLYILQVEVASILQVRDDGWGEWVWFDGFRKRWGRGVTLECNGRSAHQRSTGYRFYF